MGEPLLVTPNLRLDVPFFLLFFYSLFNLSPFFFANNRNLLFSFPFFYFSYFFSLDFSVEKENHPTQDETEKKNKKQQQKHTHHFIRQEKNTSPEAE